MNNIAVILCRPKYSENVGSVARACVNMGCSRLIIAGEQGFDPERAAPLATPKGAELLHSSEHYPDLQQALMGFHRVFATSARVGGWRKGIFLPWQAAQEIMRPEALDQDTALVFGPEDKGLANQEIELCPRIISIPTTSQAWSLNLSQAVLLVLYECFKHVPAAKTRYIPSWNSPPATQEQMQLLHQNIQEALLLLDFLQPDNPDYFMLPLKRFLAKTGIRQHEFNLLMGICRQIKWMAGPDDPPPGPASGSQP